MTVLKRSKLGIRLLYLITFLQLCVPQKREQARRHKHCLRKPKNNYAINPIYLHYESKCLLSKHKLKDERNFFRSLSFSAEGGRGPYASFETSSRAEIYLRFSFKILFVNLRLNFESGDGKRFHGDPNELHCHGYCVFVRDDSELN